MKLTKKQSRKQPGPKMGLDHYLKRDEAEKLCKQYQSIELPHVIELLEKTMPKDRTIVSLGCGSGRDEAALVRLGYDVIGTDGSAAMLAEAKKYHPELKTKQVILPELPFAKQKLGGVFSIAMLMHLSTEDIKKSLENIFESLEDGRNLVLSVSLNRNDTDERGFDSQGRYFNELSQKDWQDMAQEAGFEIIEENIFGDSLGRNGVAWLTTTLQKQEK